MKFTILVVLLWCGLSSCEIIGPDAKKVPYLLEVQADFSFVHTAGTGLANTIRTLDRLDFDIPIGADITQFRIRDINLSVVPIQEVCEETFIRYGVRNEALQIGGLYEETFDNELAGAGNLLIDAFISHQFDQSLATISRFISDEIMNGGTVTLYFLASCNDLGCLGTASFQIDVDYNFIVEYTLCEDVFESPELEFCNR